jgi:hypothetical protein
MTTIMAPLGLAGHVQQAQSNNRISKVLQDGKADPAIRTKAAESVFEALKSENPQAAANFALNAEQAISAGRPMTLDGIALERPTTGKAEYVNLELPVAPSILGPTTEQQLADPARFEQGKEQAAGYLRDQAAMMEAGQRPDDAAFLTAAAESIEEAETPEQYLAERDALVQELQKRGIGNRLLTDEEKYGPKQNAIDQQVTEGRKQEQGLVNVLAQAAVKMAQVPGQSAIDAARGDKNADEINKAKLENILTVPAALTQTTITPSGDLKTESGPGPSLKQQQSVEVQNAVNQGRQPVGNQQQYQGVAAGTAVPANQTQVRQEEGEQAGGGNRAGQGARVEGAGERVKKMPIPVSMRIEPEKYRVPEEQVRKEVDKRQADIQRRINITQNGMNAILTNELISQEQKDYNLASRRVDIANLEQKKAAITPAVVEEDFFAERTKKNKAKIASRMAGDKRRTELFGTEEDDYKRIQSLGGIKINSDKWSKEEWAIVPPGLIGKYAPDEMASMMGLEDAEALKEVVKNLKTAEDMRASKRSEAELMERDIYKDEQKRKWAEDQKDLNQVGERMLLGQLLNGDTFRIKGKPFTMTEREEGMQIDNGYVVVAEIPYSEMTGDEEIFIDKDSLKHVVEEKPKEVPGQLIPEKEMPFNLIQDKEVSEEELVRRDRSEAKRVEEAKAKKLDEMAQTLPGVEVKPKLPMPVSKREKKASIAQIEITVEKAVEQGKLVKLPFGTIKIKADYVDGKTATVNAGDIETLAGVGAIKKLTPLQGKDKPVPGEITVKKAKMPAPKSEQDKGRLEPSKATKSLPYLNEQINYGGELRSRGSVIAEMQKAGTTQKQIDAYMMGSKTVSPDVVSVIQGGKTLVEMTLDEFKGESKSESPIEKLKEKTKPVMREFEVRYATKEGNRGKTWAQALDAQAALSVIQKEFNAEGTGKNATSAIEKVNKKRNKLPPARSVEVKALQQIGDLGWDAETRTAMTEASKREGTIKVMRGPLQSPWFKSAQDALAWADKQGPVEQAIRTPQKTEAIKDVTGKQSEQAVEPQSEAVASEEVADAEAQIADFGEKIGGARKDTAVKTGPKVDVAKSDSDVPAWRRQYKVWEQEDRSYMDWVMNRPGNKTSKWLIARVQGDRVVSESSAFDTKEEAEKNIALYAVAQNHRVYPDRVNDEYSIRRILSNKRAPVVKGGFKTREDAMKYMSEHAEEIITHQFAFPEKPWLDKIERLGKDRREGKNVTPKMFQDTFGFRGGEFGNWNMGSDGQAALNYAYDALLDLADALNIPPKAVSLNGNLAIAFGARGHGGKEAARAHYERDKAVINLTKIRGAGSLAHEWFHALDNYLGQMGEQSTIAEDKAMLSAAIRGKVVERDVSRRMATEGLRSDSKLRTELREAFNRVVKVMTGKMVIRQVVEDAAAKQRDRMKDGLRSTIKTIRDGFTYDLTQYKKNAKKSTSEQLVEFDKLAEDIVAGKVGEKVFIEGSKLNRFGGFESFQAIRKLNDLYKSVQGRSFDRADQDSYGRQLFWQIKSLQDAEKRVAQAKPGATEEKLEATDFLKEAKRIDSFRASDYWSTPVEMGARAFESFVYDKLQGQKERSDYLASGVENKFYDLFDMKPYPEDAERKAIGDAFMDLFKTVKTRETEKGVAMYGDITKGEYNERRPENNVGQGVNRGGGVSAMRSDGQWNALREQSRNGWQRKVDAKIRESQGGIPGVAITERDKEHWEGVTYSEETEVSLEFRRAYYHFLSMGYDVVPISWVKWGAAVDHETKTVFWGEMTGSQEAEYFLRHEAFHVQKQQGNVDVNKIVAAVNLNHPEAHHQAKTTGLSGAALAEELAAAFVGGMDSLAPVIELQGRQDLRDRIVASQGAAKFSLGEGEGAGLSRAEVIDSVNAVADLVGPVNILQSETEIPAPVMKEAEARGYAGRIEGFEYQGDIYLVADNMKDGRHAQTRALHEAFHAGFEKAFTGEQRGKILTATLTKFGRMMELAAIARKYDLNLANEADYERAMNELIAKITQERASKPKVWARFIGAIRQALRDMGVLKTLSDADMDYLIEKALVARAEGGRGEALFSLADDSLSVLHDHVQAGRLDAGVEKAARDVAEKSKRMGLEVTFDYIDEIGRVEPSEPIFTQQLLAEGNSYEEIETLIRKGGVYYRVRGKHDPLGRGIGSAGTRTDTNVHESDAERMGVARDEQKGQTGWKITLFKGATPKTVYHEFVHIADKVAGRVATEQRAKDLSGRMERGEDVRFSLADQSPIWYSRLERAIANVKMPRLSLDQLMAATKQNVDSEERQWTGFDEWIDEKRKAGVKTITKDEALEFVRENAVQVKEVVKGDDLVKPYQGSRVIDETRFEIKPYKNGLQVYYRQSQQPVGSPFPSRSREIAILRAEEAIGERLWETTEDYEQRREPTAKFSQYQTPGGKNYREILLTLPVKPLSKYDALELKYEKKYGKDWNSKINDDERQEFFKLNWAKESKLSTRKDIFKSSHWDEPNVLAHVRMNDRVDADGKKVLFIEEVQSDWHQKGRERGYQEKPLSNARRAELMQLGDKRTSEQETEFQADQNRILGNLVPSAPFKTSWPMLAMRRMIRYAAENGYDKIAWTTGEMQAERYDLSKQVDEISYTPHDKVLKAKRGGKTVIEQITEQSELSSYVGKEAAKRLIDGISERNPFEPSILSGGDLKIGGEGMKAFYDRILPNEVNKFVKKWGGRVGETKVQAGETNEMLPRDQQTEEKWFADKRPIRIAVPSLDITPAMRESVMAEGVPMFSLADQEAPGDQKLPDDYTAFLMQKVDESVPLTSRAATTGYTFGKAEGKANIQERIKKTGDKLRSKFAEKMDQVRKAAEEKREKAVLAARMGERAKGRKEGVKEGMAIGFERGQEEAVTESIEQGAKLAFAEIARERKTRYFDTLRDASSQLGAMEANLVNRDVHGNETGRKTPEQIEEMQKWGLARLFGQERYNELLRRRRRDIGSVIMAVRDVLHKELSGHYVREVEKLLMKTKPDRMLPEFRDTWKEKVAELSPEELTRKNWEKAKELWEELNQIIADNRGTVQFLGTARRQDAQAAGESAAVLLNESMPAIKGIEKATPSRRGRMKYLLGDKAGNAQTRALTLADGSENETATEILYDNLRQADTAARSFEAETIKPITDMLKAQEVSDNQMIDLRTRLREYKVGGQTVILNDAEKIELAAAWQDPETKLHIALAGFMPKRRTGQPSARILGDSPGQMTDIVEDIIKTLTQEQKALVNKMVDQLTGMAKEANKVSVIRDGWEKFTKSRYWPRRVERSTTQQRSISAMVTLPVFITNNR